ncbi:hypothetical protein ES703_12940 [subsurface metagenome]
MNICLILRSDKKALTLFKVDSTHSLLVLGLKLSYSLKRWRQVGFLTFFKIPFLTKLSLKSSGNSTKVRLFSERAIKEFLKISSIRAPQASDHIFLKTSTNSPACSSGEIPLIFSKGLKLTIALGLVGSIKIILSSNDLLE